MQAIILAGGFGTRLQSVVKSVPKPMADINGKPFLQYILQYLSFFNIEKVILSVGYKQDTIKKYFKNRYKNIVIEYSCEDMPLGTGGAIKKALKLVDDETVFVLNGDTFVDIDLTNFMNSCGDKTFDIIMGLKKMYNFDRYGSVVISNGKIIEFKEKKFTTEGYINIGTYVISKQIFDKIDTNSFSFEDFLQNSMGDIDTYPYICKSTYFIDIGLPLDYEKCKIDFKEIF